MNHKTQKATAILEKIGKLVFLKLITSKTTQENKKVSERGRYLQRLIFRIYKGSFKSLRERKTTQWSEPRNLNGQVTEHTHTHINIPQDG